MMMAMIITHDDDVWSVEGCGEQGKRGVNVWGSCHIQQKNGQEKVAESVVSNSSIISPGRIMRVMI